MKNRYSKEIQAIIQENIDKLGWCYKFDQDHGIFIFDLKVKSPEIKSVRCFIRVSLGTLSIYTLFPISTNVHDVEMTQEMAKFICLANYGLDAGCFEFSLDEGDIRYKIFIDCDKMLPSSEILRNSLCYSLCVIESYTPGLTSVIFKKTNAKQAIALCETVDEIHEVDTEADTSDDAEKMY